MDHPTDGKKTIAHYLPTGFDHVAAGRARYASDNGHMQTTRASATLASDYGHVATTRAKFPKTVTTNGKTEKWLAHSAQTAL